MAGRAKVVITDYVWESLDVERKTLGDLAEIVALKTKKPEEFLSEARDCDALLNTYAGPITAEAMSGMPRCKIIARYGIGVDTIDLDAATQAGIIVTNNPTYCIEEVAEQTMALILSSARKIPFYDRMVRSGRWEVPPGKPIYRLAGRTLGLVGFGNIARQVAVRAAAFGLDVLYSDPFVKEGQFKVPGRAVDLDTRWFAPWTRSKSRAPRSTRWTPSRFPILTLCAAATTSSSTRTSPGTVSRRWRAFRPERRAKFAACSRESGR